MDVVFLTKFVRRCASSSSTSVDGGGGGDGSLNKPTANLGIEIFSMMCRKSVGKTESDRKRTQANLSFYQRLQIQLHKMWFLIIEYSALEWVPVTKWIFPRQRRFRFPSFLPDQNSEEDTGRKVRLGVGVEYFEISNVPLFTPVRRTSTKSTSTHPTSETIGQGENDLENNNSTTNINDNNTNDDDTTNNNDNSILRDPGTVASLLLGADHKVEGAESISMSPEDYTKDLFSLFAVGKVRKEEVAEVAPIVAVLQYYIYRQFLVRSTCKMISGLFFVMCKVVTSSIPQFAEAYPLFDAEMVSKMAFLGSIFVVVDLLELWIVLRDIPTMSPFLPFIIGANSDMIRKQGKYFFVTMVAGMGSLLLQIYRASGGHAESCHD